MAVRPGVKGLGWPERFCGMGEMGKERGSGWQRVEIQQIDSVGIQPPAGDLIKPARGKRKGKTGRCGPACAKGIADEHTRCYLTSGGWVKDGPGRHCATQGVRFGPCLTRDQVREVGVRAIGSVSLGKRGDRSRHTRSL